MDTQPTASRQTNIAVKIVLWFLAGCLAISFVLVSYGAYWQFFWVRLEKQRAVEKVLAQEKGQMEGMVKRQEVKMNLQMIMDIADFCFRNNPQMEKISVKELIAWTKSLSENGTGAFQLKSVVGEQYDSLVILKDSQSISITLPDGMTVSLETPTPANQSSTAQRP